MKYTQREVDLSMKLDAAITEIERLRAETWVGLERAKDVRNAAIEECARMAEETVWDIAAAIRALKDKL